VVNKPAKTRAKKTVRKTRKKVAPKYRNPADESQTWTGRGREPLWIKELVEKGAELNDLPSLMLCRTLHVQLFRRFYPARIIHENQKFLDRSFSTRENVIVIELEKILLLRS